MFSRQEGFARYLSKFSLVLKIFKVTEKGTNICLSAYESITIFNATEAK